MQNKADNWALSIYIYVTSFSLKHIFRVSSENEGWGTVAGMLFDVLYVDT